MTTEQMNEALSDYIESEFVFQYHMDWNSLMLVIDKLKSQHRRSDSFREIMTILESSMTGIVLLRFVHEACYKAVKKINNDNKKNTGIKETQ
jgi:hypothetical protein